MRHALLVLIASVTACGASDTNKLALRMQACNDQVGPPAAVMTACKTLLDEQTLRPDQRVPVLFWRAQARLRAGDVTAALLDLDELIELDSTKPVAYGLRGAVRGTDGDLPGAIADFDRALALDPKSTDSLGNRGKALADSGAHARAIEDFDRAIALAPSMASHRNGSCWSRAVLGVGLDRAQVDCDAGVQLAPGDGNLLNSRAFLAFKRNDLPGALRGYDAAVGLDPKAASSYYMRGRVKRLLGDPTADEDLARGIAVEPAVAVRYAQYGVPAL